MDFKSNISGVQNLDKVFNNLPRSMQRKAYMQALRAGAIPVRDAARENIAAVSKPFTGVLSRKGSVVIYNYKKSRGNYRVGVQIKRNLLNNKVKGEPVRVGLYAAVLEYGSAKLNRRPRSWIRKAIREQKERAVSSITKEMSRRMVDAVRDAGGK